MRAAAHAVKHAVITKPVVFPFASALAVRVRHIAVLVDASLAAITGWDE